MNFRKVWFLFLKTVFYPQNIMRIKITNKIYLISFFVLQNIKTLNSDNKNNFFKNTKIMFSMFLKT